MNLHDSLLEGRTSEAVAVIDDEGRHWTYEQLRSLVSHLAGYLEHATESQDRCLVMADNTLFWLCSILACLRAGRVAVPIAPDAPFATLERILRQCAPRIAFVDSAHCDRLMGQIDTTTLVVCDEDSERQGTLSWTEASAFVPSEHSFAVDEGSIAAILYTSSASAQPRGAVLTHHNLAAAERSTASHLHLGPTDRTSYAVGLFSCLGLSSAFAQLRTGGTLILEHTLPSPDPALLVARAIEHGTTGIIAGADTLQALIDRTGFSATSLPSLRYIEHVGGKAPAGLIAELQQLFPHAAIHQMYGLAEAGGALAAVPAQLAITKSSAVGEPLPGVRLLVADPYGHPLEPGQTGEIVAESQAIARGYWQEPELSHRFFRKGQLHTGDMGHFDEDGQLHLAGKSSDYLRLGGVPTSTAEIEPIIALFPGLREVAVLSRQDEILGSVVVLVAVHPRGDEVRQQLLQFCAGKLPFSQRPHEVHFRSHLPRNSDGQVDRTTLQQQIELEQHVLEPTTDQLQAPGQSLQA